MINRGNWKAMKKYLAYRRDVDQINIDTARLEETWLRHLLEWAQERSFADAPKIKPSLPIYLLDARRDGSDEPLSKAYLKKIIGAGARFFEWLRIHKTGYSALSAIYLDTLKLPRMAEKPNNRKAVTLDEIRAMAQAKVSNLREERIRAAAVFLFLSGIRVTAFTTLSLQTIDLQELTVKQWPSLGVRTKNKKHSTTYLLNIPDLIAVVRSWDDYLHSLNLPAAAPWFASLSPVTGAIDISSVVADVGQHRDVKVRQDLKRWCERVNLPYYSPHKFRHGHAEYSLNQADDFGDMKAISQNLMHSSITVTDSIYSMLSDDNAQKRILNLGREDSASQEDLVKLLRNLADEIEQQKQ